MKVTSHDEPSVALSFELIVWLSEQQTRWVVSASHKPLIETRKSHFLCEITKRKSWQVTEWFDNVAVGLLVKIGEIGNCLVHQGCMSAILEDFLLPDAQKSITASLKHC